MRIRKTTLNDLEPVMAMYDYARKFMQEHGNPNQWINGYPSEEYIRREIADGHSYICENEQGETVGTFCFIVGERHHFEKKILKFVTITRIHKSEKRPSVMMDVNFGGQIIKARFSLADREKFEYQALVGRNILTGRAIVDTALSNTLR